MKKATLKIISDVLTGAGIPYQYMEFNGDISALNQYWIGEYSEAVGETEDGMQESTFMLTGTSKGSYIALEDTKGAIENLFPAVAGYRAILADGTGVAIHYSNALQVPTGDAMYKRLQVNLSVKEWKVN